MARKRTTRTAPATATWGKSSDWDEFMGNVKQAASSGLVVDRCSVRAGDRIIDHHGTTRVVADSYAAPRARETWVLTYTDGDERGNFSMAGFFYPMTLAAS